MDTRDLPRSISSTDLSCTTRCRDHIKKDWVRQGPPRATTYFNITPAFTLTVPPLDGYPPDFKTFLFNRLINYGTKKYLEESRCLNWCQGATTLVPLYTLGDGNCLMHAASLGMWGFQDRDFILRKAVHEAIVRSQDNTLYPRWKMAREAQLLQVNCRLDQHEWDREWSQIIRNVSLETTQHGSYDSLEEFHIFVLANVLRRPIIVYAETKLNSGVGGETLQNLEFDGVYLPLLWDPRDCKRSPLPIAFTNGHFQALSIIDLPKEFQCDGTGEYLVLPLVDAYNRRLPIRFTLPEERQYNIPAEYLDLIDFQPPMYGGRTLCAKLRIPKTPSYLLPLLQGFITKCFDVFGQNPASSSPSGGSDGALCLAGCGLYGDATRFQGFCSQCYKKFNSNPHHQQVRDNQGEVGVSSLRCSNNCNNPGFPKFLGMCETCFKKKQASGSSSHSPPPNTSNAAEGGQKKCMTPGCEFFGSAETKFYCSKCVNEKFEEIAKKNDGSAGNYHVMKQSQQQLVIGKSNDRPYGDYERPSDRHNDRPHSGYDRANDRPYGDYERPSDRHNDRPHSGYDRANDRPYDRPNDRPYDRANDRPYDRPNDRPYDRANNEPLCTRCEVYHASQEYGGLCHSCFMDKTKEEAGKPPRHAERQKQVWSAQVAPPSQPHISRRGSGQDIIDNQEPLVRPQTDVANIKPTPVPRKLKRAPTLDTTYERKACCLCQLDIELAEMSYICRTHAAAARTMFAAAFAKEGGDRGRVDRGQRDFEDVDSPDQYQSNLSSVVRSKNPPQPYKRSSDYDLHEGLHGTPSDPPAGVPNDPPASIYVPKGQTTNNFSSDRYANLEAPASQFSDHRREPPLNDDRSRNYPGPGGGYQNQPPPESYHRDQPYASRYDSPRSDRRGSNDYPSHYGDMHHERRQDNVRETGAATGGMGGATGGGGAGGSKYYDIAKGEVVAQDPTKILCKVVGCSFYGKEELGGFCNNCHKEYVIKKRPLPRLNET